jgi:hypothetical protein
MSDLILEKSNVTINLGPRDQYTMLHVDEASFELHATWDLEAYWSDLMTLVAYSPKGVEELEELRIKLDSILRDFEDTILRHGRSYVIRRLIEDGWRVKREGVN